VADKIHSLELSGKEIFCDYDETKSKEALKTKRRRTTERVHIAGREHDTSHGGSRAISKLH